MQNGASPGPKYRSIGRVRAAWYVLMGQPITPQHILAEWVEYQQIFNDLLERWSAKLARDARAEKERIKRLDLPEPRVEPLQRPQTKTELRRQVAAARGLSGLQFNLQTHETEVKDEPDS